MKQFIGQDIYKVTRQLYDIVKIPPGGMGHNGEVARLARKIILSAATVCFILAGFAHAGRAEPQFSLPEAVRFALRNNEEIKATGFALAAGKEDIGLAKSGLAPRFSFEERAMRTNNPGYVLSLKMNQNRFSALDLAGAPATFNQPGAINDYQSSLGFEQLLFARKASLGVTMAEGEYAAQAGDYQRKRQEIALRVVQSFLAVHTASQYITAREQTLADAREHLRVAESRYNSGLGLYSDMLRASTAVFAAEQRLVSARKNLEVARRQLGLILGLDGSAAVKDDFPAVPTVNALDHYNAAALKRPDVVSLATRYENARRGVEAARAGYLPVLGVGASYQYNDRNHLFGSEGESWLVSAFLRWDVFDGGRTASELKKAKMALQGSAENLQGTKKAVLFKVYDAYLSVEEAGKNVELAKASASSAEEGKRLVEKRYFASLSPLVDLLDAQVNLDEARANLVARENEYRLAVAVLDFESGLILKSLAIE